MNMTDTKKKFYFPRKKVSKIAVSIFTHDNDPTMKMDL